MRAEKRFLCFLVACASLALACQPSLAKKPAAICQNTKKSVKRAGKKSCKKEVVHFSDKKILTNTQLKEYAIAAFDRFKEKWNFHDFWKRGNTGDACVCLATALLDHWTDDPAVKKLESDVKDMLFDNLVYFSSFDPATLWADDFGWWGLLGVNAYTFLKKMGDLPFAQEYLRLTTELCWQYMKDTAYDKHDTAQPIQHGCFNGDAKGQHRGVKNTVTNALLFLLSTRIYRLHKQENLPDPDSYLEMAYKQWVWFSSWFTLQNNDFLKAFGADAALVHERPLAFFQGSGYEDTQHPPWQKGWAWSGDHGLLIAALLDMHALKNDLADLLKRIHPDKPFDKEVFERDVQQLISRLATGIRKAFICDKDDIIREAPFNASFGSAHGRDYVAGRGIMVRYLRAEKEKPRLGVDFSTPIHATVEALWQTREKETNQFHPAFTSTKNDRSYNESFRSVWGTGDEVIEWDLSPMDRKQRLAVCQAVGLDFLAAALAQ